MNLNALTLFVLLAVSLCFSISNTFYGKGRFLFSYARRAKYSFDDSLYGTVISYRPQNYQTYSPIPSGDVDLVKMIYAQDYTYSAAVLAKNRKSFSTSDDKVMVWSTAGRHFYYKHNSIELQTGQYISVTVEMYGRYGETIYQENFTRGISTLSICYPEAADSPANSQLCSTSLDDDTLWDDYPDTSHTSRTENTMYTTLSRLETGYVEEEKNDGLSDKSLAAAVSVPLGIVIIVAVLVGAILIRKRMHNNVGSGESQSTTRGDNTGGPQGRLALTQLSAAYPQTLGHKQEQYETPIQPQQPNVYESLRPYRPPLPQPKSSTQPAPIQQYSGQSYSYVGPQQDEAPRKAPPAPPAVAAVGRSHIYSSESSVIHRYDDDVSCTDDGYTYPKECDS